MEFHDSYFLYNLVNFIISESNSVAIEVRITGAKGNLGNIILFY